MQPTTREALVERLSGYDRAVEVGIGRRTDVAAALARTARVTATDIHERSVPDGVRFVRDDVTAPDRSVYEGAGVIYALNCPPELHRPLWDLARSVGADCVFTTLGGDPPTVPVTSETLPGETLFRATPLRGELP